MGLYLALGDGSLFFRPLALLCCLPLLSFTFTENKNASRRLFQHCDVDGAVTDAATPRSKGDDEQRLPR